MCQLTPIASSALNYVSGTWLALLLLHQLLAAATQGLLRACVQSPYIYIFTTLHIYYHTYIYTYRKRHITSKLNSKMVSVLPSLIFPIYLLPCPVHPTGFSFCFFPGFLAIFIFVVIEQQQHTYRL